MSTGNPLLAVHNALARALFKDLPDICYEITDWASLPDPAGKRPKKQLTRRPSDQDVEVIMFPQTWGSTALGYGGIGGASMQTEYTVVVHDQICYCVYFGQGELAYTCSHSQISAKGSQNFMADIQAHRMADRQNAHTRYS